ncbi:hypothetical protein [Streptomyces sp. WMMB 322]|uniref:hypothetical protein n=1 Tax=Streptomyces sp. WMMB 322 TaxID=1286821 RepID=UPI0006E38B1F|nr:hypothetical protein [Streptomyces sp. WMMB 322]SCK31292.1 hypothetical protein H180DRAFT_02476 [Streptomyces sp. WMMB 322]
MPKHPDAEPAVERAEYALAPPLPDLSGVDLRTLRRLDTPALTAAVAHVLRGPGERGELFGQNAPGPSPSGAAGPCDG